MMHHPTCGPIVLVFLVACARGPASPEPEPRVVDVSPVAAVTPLAPPRGSSVDDAGAASDASETPAPRRLSLSADEVEKSLRTISATERELPEDGLGVVAAVIVGLVERAEGGPTGRKRPLVVLGVAPAQLAWKLGFRNGDRLVAIDANDLAVAGSSARDRARELLEGAERRKRFSVGIVRNGAPTELVYRLTR